jgi:3-hexulose-6-phosphate synthase
MKLQITLDDISTRDAINRVRPFADLVDIIEVGTPLLLEEGMASIELVRTTFPGLEVLADTKIWHNGASIAARAFAHGAHLVTVLAGATDHEIRSVVSTAEAAGCAVAADMSDSRGLVQRAEELEELGVRYMMVPSGLRDEHIVSQTATTAVDTRALGGTPLALVRNVRRGLQGTAEVAVVDNITLSNVDEVVALEPAILLVGRAILAADDPRAAATEFRQHMDAS